MIWEKNSNNNKKKNNILIVGEVKVQLYDFCLYLCLWTNQDWQLNAS